jgi:hypothetical protein
MNHEAVPLIIGTYNFNSYEAVSKRFISTPHRFFAPLGAGVEDKL